MPLAPPIYMNPEAAYNKRFVISVCCYRAERAEKIQGIALLFYAWVLLSVRAKNSNNILLVQLYRWLLKQV
jgi:hypothetical protein